MSVDDTTEYPETLITDTPSVVTRQVTEGGQPIWSNKGIAQPTGEVKVVTPVITGEKSEEGKGPRM